MSTSPRPTPSPTPPANPFPYPVPAEPDFDPDPVVGVGVAVSSSAKASPPTATTAPATPTPTHGAMRRSSRNPLFTTSAVSTVPANGRISSLSQRRARRPSSSNSGAGGRPSEVAGFAPGAVRARKCREECKVHTGQNAPYPLGVACRPALVGSRPVPRPAVQRDRGLDRQAPLRPTVPFCCQPGGSLLPLAPTQRAAVSQRWPSRVSMTRTPTPASSSRSRSDVA